MVPRTRAVTRAKFLARARHLDDARAPTHSLKIFMDYKLNYIVLYLLFFSSLNFLYSNMGINDHTKAISHLVDTVKLNNLKMIDIKLAPKSMPSVADAQKRGDKFKCKAVYKKILSGEFEIQSFARARVARSYGPTQNHSACSEIV